MFDKFKESLRRRFIVNIFYYGNSAVFFTEHLEKEGCKNKGSYSKDAFLYSVKEYFKINDSKFLLNYQEALHFYNSFEKLSKIKSELNFGDLDVFRTKSPPGRFLNFCFDVDEDIIFIWFDKDGAIMVESSDYLSPDEINDKFNSIEDLLKIKDKNISKKICFNLDLLSDIELNECSIPNIYTLKLTLASIIFVSIFIFAGDGIKQWLQRGGFFS